MNVAKNDLWLAKGVIIRAGSVIKDHHNISEKEIKQLIAKGAVRVLNDKDVMEPAENPGVDTNVTKPWQWGFATADLEGKTLDQLNMMAADHCAAHQQIPIEPFEDVEEAIAYMTQDLGAS